MIDGRRPIHYAADYGQKEILEYLIQLGANVNVNRFLFFINKNELIILFFNVYHCQSLVIRQTWNIGIIGSYMGRTY